MYDRLKQIARLRVTAAKHSELVVHIKSTITNINSTPHDTIMLDNQLKQAVEYYKEQFGLGGLRGVLTPFGWNMLKEKGLV